MILTAKTYHDLPMHGRAALKLWALSFIPQEVWNRCKEFRYDAYSQKVLLECYLRDRKGNFRKTVGPRGDVTIATEQRVYTAPVAMPSLD
jgi:hypothetical protein